MTKRTNGAANRGPATSNSKGAAKAASTAARPLPPLGSRTGAPKASAARSAASTAPHRSAAQRRINQRRKERMTQRVRRLEAVLPLSMDAAWRPSLPDIGAWPLWKPLTLTVVGLAGWIHSDERWFLYREDVRFSGLTYLGEEELWQSSAIDGWNMFWLDTDEVRNRLLANPYVADADVYVSPVAGAVHVDVTESRPIALWVTDDGTRWLLPNGTAVVPRGATPPDLLQIIDGGSMATAPGAALGSAIDLEVLESARSLLEVLPGVEPLRYNRQIGLNFQLQEMPYWVYWGDGANVERKLENLAASVQLLEDGTVEGTVIDVRFERPYVK
jgi:cell division protein FtsQ